MGSRHDAARRDRLAVGIWLAVVTVLSMAALGSRPWAIGLVGLAAALGGGWLLLKRPERAIWIVLVLIYSNALVVGVTMHGLPSFAAFALPALLAIPLVDNVVRQKPIVVPAPSYWMVAFSGAMFIAAASSSDVQRSFGEIRVFLTEGIGIYFGVVNVLRSRRQLEAATKVIAVTAAALAGLSVFQWLTRSYDNDFMGFAQVSKAVITVDPVGDTQPRIAGPVGEKNRYAQVLSVAVPLAAGLAWTAATRASRRWWWACSTVLLLAVALTYSRGAAVGMLPILLLAARMRRVKLASILLAAGAVFLLVIAVPGYRDRLASLGTVGGATAATGEQGETDGAIRGRVTQNLAALQVFTDHPVVGVGPGMFPAFYPAYAQDIGIRPRLIEREAHNLWLDIASDTGLIGIVTFLGLVVSVLRRLWRRFRAGDLLAGAYFLAVLAYQATGIFLHLSYARYYWLLMALATVAASVEHERRSDVERDRLAVS